MRSLLDGECVDIYVGPSRKHWNLPKKLLWHHSPFFAKAFNGNFREGIEGRIELREDDIAAFRLLVRWMFTNTITRPKNISKQDVGVIWGAHLVEPELGVDSEALEDDPESLFESGLTDVEVQESGSSIESSSAPWKGSRFGLWVYVKLYVLADKLGMVGLQDHIICLLRRTSVYFFIPEVVTWIYQNTVSSSPLRRYAARMAARASLSYNVTPEYYTAIFASCEGFAPN